MRKRFFLLLLAATMLFASCSAKPDEEMYQSLVSRHEAYACEKRAEIGFMMEASFRDDDSGKAGVLYYMNGEARYDSASETAWQSFTATLLAATYKAEEYYADGKKTHIESGEVLELEMSADDFFGAFPYRTVPLPAFSEVIALTEERNGDATLYTLTASSGQKELIEEVWKLNLYELAGITVPNTEKESYGDVTYTFSVKDGKVQSLMVKLAVSVYETPGYTLGYTPKDEDYRLDLTVTAQISVRNTGETVEIPVYSEVEG